VSGIFRANRKKTFSIKRENEADKLMDNYIQKRFENMRDKTGTGKLSILSGNA
jgi:hypothetical protein